MFAGSLISGVITRKGPLKKPQRLLLRNPVSSHLPENRLRKPEKIRRNLVSKLLEKA
jgi:hypothetical protein